MGRSASGFFGETFKGPKVSASVLGNYSAMIEIISVYCRTHSAFLFCISVFFAPCFLYVWELGQQMSGGGVGRIDRRPALELHKYNMKCTQLLENNFTRDYEWAADGWGGLEGRGR